MDDVAVGKMDARFVGPVDLSASPANSPNIAVSRARASASVPDSRCAISIWLRAMGQACIRPLNV